MAGMLCQGVQAKVNLARPNGSMKTNYILSSSDSWKLMKKVLAGSHRDNLSCA